MCSENGVVEKLAWAVWWRRDTYWMNLEPKNQAAKGKQLPVFLFSDVAAWFTILKIHVHLGLHCQLDPRSNRSVGRIICPSCNDVSDVWHHTKQLTTCSWYVSIPWTCWYVPTLISTSWVPVGTVSVPSGPTWPEHPPGDDTAAALFLVLHGRFRDRSDLDRHGGAHRVRCNAHARLGTQSPGEWLTKMVDDWVLNGCKWCFLVVNKC